MDRGPHVAVHARKKRSLRHTAEMTLMQLCLTVNDKWLVATAQTIDRSVFRPQSFFSVVRVFAELDGVVFAVRGHR